MLAVLTVIHVLVALVLILFVLLQSAKGTDLAGAFGGMGSQTAFGPRGTTTFLSKTTAILAGVFMVTSLTMAILSNRSHGGGSVLSGEKVAPVPKPAAPPAGGTPVNLPPGTFQATTPDGKTVPVQPKITIIPAPKKDSAPNGKAPAGNSQPQPPPADMPPATPSGAP